MTYGRTPRNSSGVSDRLIGLDTIRGVAIWLVLLRHMPKVDTLPLVQRGLNLMHVVGWVGVDLFFVLSGFLIYRLILVEQRMTGAFNWKRFLVRRGFKIWPSYFAAFGAMMIAIWFTGQTVWERRDVIVNSVFLQNYLDCRRWPHSWSIAVEEHFYTVLAISIAIITAAGRYIGLITSAAVAVIVITPIARVTTYLSSDSYEWARFYYASHFRADSLCMGVFLAYLFERHREWALPCFRANSLAAFLGFGIMIGVPWVFNLETSWILGTIGYSVIGGGAFMVVGWVVASEEKIQRLSRGGLSIPVRALALSGRYSYSIYLAHSVLPPVWQTTAWSKGTPNVAVYFFGSFLVSYVLSQLIEEPFLQLRSKLCPSHRRANS